MQRIVLWLLSTVSVLVLLFGYNTSSGTSRVVGSSTSIISGSATGSTSSSGSTAGSPSGGSTGGSNSSKASAAKTVTGDVAQTQWGPVQVELTVKAGSITQVNVVQYPSGNSQDDQINSYALPVLIQETLDQQTAGIDMVSGATVTSTGYLQSLQSALDRAGA